MFQHEAKSETPERRFSIEALRQGQGGRPNVEEDTIDGGELIGISG